MSSVTDWLVWQDMSESIQVVDDPDLNDDLNDLEDEEEMREALEALEEASDDERNLNMAIATEFARVACIEVRTDFGLHNVEILGPAKLDNNVDAFAEAERRTEFLRGILNTAGRVPPEFWPHLMKDGRNFTTLELEEILNSLQVSYTVSKCQCVA